MKNKSPGLEQYRDYWIAQDKKYGKALCLLRPWSRRYLGVVKRRHIKIIRLNDRIGWSGTDISFVPKIPGIWGLDLMSDKVTDVSPIFEIVGLRTVSLFCKSKVAGDFLKLRKLESVGLQWRPVYKSIFGLRTLRQINILGFPHVDLTCWAANKMASELRLESRTLQSLAGIERFPSLKRLHLFRCRNLNRLDALPNAQSIREIQLSHCPSVNDLSEIAKLRDLRILEIQSCGAINSVAPLARCKKLQRLQISGNTVAADRDLSPLKNCKGLKEVLLAHKKYYSHTAEELERH
jgi:hypothetical protein